MSRKMTERGRVYAKEYESSPEQIHNRVLRNKARREAIEAGIVKKGDGIDIDHRVPLDQGGTNDKSNLRPVPRGKNRGFARDSKGNPKVPR